MFFYYCDYIIFMFLMSTSLVLCDNFIFINQRLHLQSSFFFSRNSSLQSSSGGGRRRFCRFITNAKDTSNSNHSDHSRKKNRWFQWFFFFNEDGNWFGLKDEDMVDDGTSSRSNPCSKKLPVKPFHSVPVDSLPGACQQLSCSECRLKAFASSPWLSSSCHANAISQLDGV